MSSRKSLYQGFVEYRKPCSEVTVKLGYGATRDTYDEAMTDAKRMADVERANRVGPDKHGVDFGVRII